MQQVGYVRDQLGLVKQKTWAASRRPLHGPHQIQFDESAEVRGAEMSGEGRPKGAGVENAKRDGPVPLLHLRQPDRQGAPDTAAGASDQGDAVGTIRQSSHGVFPNRHPTIPNREYRGESSAPVVPRLAAIRAVVGA
jgi:hypothetical protein